MALTPGLSPNIRLQDDQPQPADLGGADIVVEMEEDGEDQPEIDMDGNILRIEHPDGTISVSLDGKPIEEPGKKKLEGWFANLAEDIDENELSRISGELIRGISSDLTSREEWIQERAQGIKLLGLKIELPGLQGTPDGAPVEGMSKVRHPLLLEAVLRFQANARSELLPTDGPVKIRDDSMHGSVERDKLADALEKDMNHYLTATAKEYYPDTDKMLLLLGFGGTAFKKVYYCPLRNRPVSESIDADDLIVNNSATDLDTARRITHRIYMRPSVVKRMQIIGAYRDIELSHANARELDAVQLEKNAQQGIQQESFTPEDRDREIYECYCELDVKSFEHKLNGEITGLEVPYRVTIDVSSKQILSLVRNYDEDTQDLPEARKNFVKYTFVPGFGFYDIGLLHILGNTTNAVTAAWRELLDAGMYANFPGFLYAKQSGRQNSNIFRVPPGGGAQIDTGGMAINEAVMPLPYKEPSAALAGLVQTMGEYGQRLGGTSEVAVGEGRQDAPVGTTVALLEQSVMVLNSVHKRMHSSQADEFQLLAQCFKENPDSFWQRNRKPNMEWDEKQFLAALDDFDLVPQADPNTSSNSQRIMKSSALMQMAMADPAGFNMVEVRKEALSTMGWDNPDVFLSHQNGPPPPTPADQAQQTAAQASMITAQAKMAETQHKIQGGDNAQPDPAEAQAKQTDAQAKQTDAQAKMLTAQAKMAEAQHKVNGGESAANQPNPQEMQLKMMSEQNKASETQQKATDMQLDALNRQRDRESRERLAAVRLAEEVMKNPADGMQVVNRMLDPSMIQRLEANEPPGGKMQ